MSNILIIEDEEKVSEVLKAYLEREGYTVYCTTKGLEGIQMFKTIDFKLIILDLMLPDYSGEDVCRILRKKSRVPIIMVTAKVDEENVLQGFNIGADDYVTKPFSPRQLVARVNALLRRVEDEAVPLSNIMSFNNNDLIIDCLKREVRKNNEVLNITPTEYKILMALIKYPSKAFTRDELVSIALGDDYDGFDRIIDSHIKNLRQKIETNPREPYYILTVHGVGYRFGGE